MNILTRTVNTESGLWRHAQCTCYTFVK